MKTTTSLLAVTVVWALALSGGIAAAGEGIFANNDSPASKMIDDEIDRALDEQEAAQQPAQQRQRLDTPGQPPATTTAAPATTEPVPTTTAAPATTVPVPTTTAAPATTVPVPTTTAAPATTVPAETRTEQRSTKSEPVEPKAAKQESGDGGDGSRASRSTIPDDVLAAFNTTHQAFLAAQADVWGHGDIVRAAREAYQTAWAAYQAECAASHRTQTESGADPHELVCYADEEPYRQARAAWLAAASAAKPSVQAYNAALDAYESAGCTVGPRWKHYAWACNGGWDENGAEAPVAAAEAPEISAVDEHPEDSIS